MADLTLTPTWQPAVYKIATSDAVLAGDESATANLQAKQLGDRTEYLKNAVDSPVAPNLKTGTSGNATANAKFVIDNSARWASVTEVTSNSAVALDKAAMGKLFVFKQTANVTYTLPDVASLNDPTSPGTYAYGQGIGFINNSSKVVIISRAGSNLFTGLYHWLSSGDQQLLWLMPGEMAFVVAIATSPGLWVTTINKSNNQDVGCVVQAITATAPQGSIVALGQEVNRADYPRLYLWAITQSMVVNDADWAANVGKFSHGNGTTTFRIPLLAGYFLRAANTTGAGLDSSRAVGSEQADEIKAHTHSLSTVTSQVGITSGSDNDVFSSAAPTATSSTGGAETRPKNIAVLTCIKY